MPEYKYKDWYVVGFNPWGKTIFNPYTGEKKVIRNKEDDNGNTTGLHDRTHK